MVINSQLMSRSHTSVVPIRDSDLKYSNLSRYPQSWALTHDDCWVYRKMGADLEAAISQGVYKMTGKTIAIKSHDGGTFGAYMAVPASGSGPGLVVLQEIFGVNGHLRAVADRWAEEGYVVLAPDLFWRLKPGVELGFGPEDVQTAREYGQRFDDENGVRDIGATIAALKSEPAFTGKVGAIGYCMGGRLAFL